MKIQKKFREYLSFRRNYAADVLSNFLRIALSARAIHIGKWAARTISRFASLCKHQFQIRKELENLKVLRLNELFIQRMVVQSTVHDHIEIGCMNVMNSLILDEQNQKNSNSFFITQSQINEEKSKYFDSLCSTGSDNATVNQIKDNTPNININDVMNNSRSKLSSPISQFNGSNHSSPSLSKHHVEESMMSQSSKQKSQVSRPLRRKSKVQLNIFNTIVCRHISLFQM